MNFKILKNGLIEPKEIYKLRQSVGWDNLEGTYEISLSKQYAYYIVRDSNKRLIGYMSVISDGVADAFLLDLVVHPQHQNNGVGSSIVRRAINDMKKDGLQSIQVTFSDKLESFYKHCGFHIFKGGIIDFKNTS